MQLLRIKDDNKKIYTDLHVDENNHFHGFSIDNGEVVPINSDVFKVFDFFKLSSKNKVCQRIDHYDVYLDEETGLYHFFKDGQEDVNKLFYFNGEIDTLALDLRDIQNNITRKFKFFGCTLVLTGIFINAYLLGEIKTRIDDGSWSDTVYYSDGVAVIDYRPFTSKVTFTFEDESLKLDKEVSLKKLKELLFSSINLDEIEKNFLWNEELMSDIIPYYGDENFGIISQARHYNILIDNYTNESEDRLSQESAGYYSGDNVLHLKDYNGDSSKLENDLETRRRMAHEYVHLLQADNGLKFIKEASAEIIVHEYYLNSADKSIYYSYAEACERVKILMEIIGTEAVWDFNFREGSTAIQEAVKPYFSEKEYKEFFDILELSPFWDKDKLENGLYDRFDQLLEILYSKKFGYNILDDDIITAIRLSDNYNRPYFRKSLIESSPTYYEKIEFYNLFDMANITNDSFRVFKYLSNDEDKAQTLDLLRTRGKLCALGSRVDSDSMDVVESNFHLSGNNLAGNVTLKEIGSTDGKVINMEINEALKLGYVKMVKYINFYVSSLELLSGEYDDYMLYPVDGLLYNYERKMFYKNTHEIIYDDRKVGDVVDDITKLA